MKHRCLALVAVAVLLGCGGESQPAAPPVAPTPPPAPTVATAETSAPAPADTTPVAPPPKPPMLDLQKKAIAGFVAGFNAHDVKASDAMYANDAVVSQAGAGGWEETTGRDAIDKGSLALWGGYPDAKVGAERVFATNEVAIVQWVMTGTNNGDFQGVKATKKPIGFHSLSVLWFNDDGLVKKEHFYLDIPTIVGQEGLLPKGTPKPRAIATAPGDTQWITDGNDKNLAAYKSEIEAFNKHDPKGVSANMVDDFAMVDYSAPADMKGKAQNTKGMGDLFKAFPDMNGTCDSLWGIGDVVICEMTATGTMKGPMMGMKPTNKAVTTHRVELEWYKDGKGTRMEAYMNGLEVIAQMKSAPPPPKTAATKP